MSYILLYFFMAVGLSMDAFSLAIVYGTNSLNKKKALILSIFVGILHFIMPNIGNLLGQNFLQGFINYGNIITGLVFLVLSIQMISSLKESNEINDLNNYLELFLFAIAVSIDSFTVGIALSLENKSLIIGGIIFSIISFIFTITGLLLGKFLSNKTGKISKIFGIIILVILTVKYFLNL